MVNIGEKYRAFILKEDFDFQVTDGGFDFESLAFEI